METKKCRICSESKRLDSFTKAAGYKDGYKNWCKACANERNQEWRRRNPEKARAIANRAAKTEEARRNRLANRARIAEEDFVLEIVRERKGHTQS